MNAAERNAKCSPPDVVRTWQSSCNEKEDIAEPITQADFLAHYNLLPDIANSWPVDQTTRLTAAGFRHHTTIQSAKLTEAVDSKYVALLQDFPALTKPPGSVVELTLISLSDYITAHTTAFF
ncbi:uncharacterized protein LOC126249399 [Schistocerca nitens]|uniref:uncharacterized protein LOC126249399 n=1 Tax=Schistocerca nitens TaxID=7011 RepID=UPI002118B9F8|nr:uncharacterized protein LOC126249399 [Schistocerca nitens]